MQGLNYLPKPFINRILIEDGRSEGPKLPGFTDLYHKKSAPAASNAIKPPKPPKIKLTFNVALKSIYPTGPQGTNNSKSFFLKEAVRTINTHILYYKFITSEATLVDFLLAEDKINYFIGNIPGDPIIQEQPSKIGNGANYDLDGHTYYDNNRPIVSVPLKIHHLYTFSGNATNPKFLACVFMYGPPPGSELLPSNTFFTSELIFRGSGIVGQTTYFTIGNRYIAKGEEAPLLASPRAVAQQAKDQGPESDSEHIISRYGRPGQVWCGPVFRSQINQKYQYMPGRKYSDIPLPYLDLKLKTNDKIVDNRIVGALENMFSYNSSNFESLLSTVTQTLYTGEKNKNTIDGYNADPAIVSEVDYSVHQIMTPDGPKSKINIWFAIDKLRMLKSTSTLAPLFDKLVALNPAFVDYFVSSVRIFNFQIFRVDLRTGQRNLLLVAPNDSYADDFGRRDSLGNSISKGYIFKKVKHIEVGIDSEHIDYYEFRDGEINVGEYDDGHYTYEIALKFEDPLVAYLGGNLATLKTILKNLDELLLKTSLKIIDNTPLKSTAPGGSIYGAATTTYTTNKMVDVYNRYYDKFNPIFIDKALNDSAYFNFNFLDEMPESIARSFRLASGIPNQDAVTNIAYTLGCLNHSNTLEPKSAFTISWSTLLEISNFIRISTTLKSTNPSLLGQVRSLLGFLEDRLTKLLSLYGLPTGTKKESGFSYTDYVKSQGDLSTPARTNDSLKINSFRKVFTESIDLYKLRNHFDWLGGSGAQTSTNRLLQTIDDVQYKTAVNKTLGFLAGPTMQEQLGDAAEMSFLPYVTEKSLALFNAPHLPQRTGYPRVAEDFLKKSYQTIRRKLYGRCTDKKEHISIPEILAYFGMRFELDLTADIQNIYEQEQAQKAVAINNLFWTDKTATGPKFYKKEFSSDNFGGDFVPIGDNIGGVGSLFGVDPSAYSGVNPFGSVANPDYAWQGGSLQKYPLKIAKSLITLAFSDNLKNYRNLSLFNVKTSDFFLGYTVADMSGPALSTALFATRNTPAPMSLLTLVGTTGPTGNSLYSKEKLNKLFFGQFFDKDNNLRLENYPLYILYLSLFGRVYYFKGFEAAAQLDRKTPTSFYFNKQVKSRIWAPITKERISAIAPGQSLYCKIEPYTNGKHIDKKFMELFLDYGQYNSHFYIRGTVPGAPGLTLDTTLGPTPGTAGGAGTGDSTIPITAQLPPNLISLPDGPPAT